MMRRVERTCSEGQGPLGKGGVGGECEGGRQDKQSLEGDQKACKWGVRGEHCGGIVMDDEEGDDDVLEREEEVLAVGREGELIPVAISQGDRVGESLEHIRR